jgi:hypothetical protein
MRIGRQRSTRVAVRRLGIVPRLLPIACFVHCCVFEPVPSKRQCSSARVGL